MRLGTKEEGGEGDISEDEEPEEERRERANRCGVDLWQAVVILSMLYE